MHMCFRWRISSLWSGQACCDSVWAGDGWTYGFWQPFSGWCQFYTILWLIDIWFLILSLTEQAISLTLFSQYYLVWFETKWWLHISQYWIYSDFHLNDAFLAPIFLPGFRSCCAISSRGLLNKSLFIAIHPISSTTGSTTGALAPIALFCFTSSFKNTMFVRICIFYCMLS